MRDGGILPSAIEAIGSTPLVELSRFSSGLEGRILAKLEFMNPGHSKKDRLARQVIEDAEKDGRLKPGQPVVEMTSGNTGTGLAIVCAVKGHPFHAVMSKGNSTERARMMKAIGATVVLVDQAPGAKPGRVTGDDLRLVEAEAIRLSAMLGAFRVDQFATASNLRAHESGTGPDIWEQSGGAVEVFVDFCGTGGSLAGCSRALKARRPDLRCYAVDPADPAHGIQGGGYGWDLPLLRPGDIDGRITVTDAEAVAACRRLARTEGLFCGFSSGANLAAAVKLLAGAERGRVIAVLLNDSGLKYLSTNLYP